MRNLSAAEIGHVSGGLLPAGSKTPGGDGGTAAPLTPAQEQQCNMQANSIMTDMGSLGLSTITAAYTSKSSGNVGTALGGGTAYLQGVALVDKLDAYAQADSCLQAHNSFNSFLGSIGATLTSFMNFMSGLFGGQNHQSGG